HLFATEFSGQRATGGGQGAMRAVCQSECAGNQHAVSSDAKPDGFRWAHSLANEPGDEPGTDQPGSNPKLRAGCDRAEAVGFGAGGSPVSCRVPLEALDVTVGAAESLRAKES